MMWINRTGAMKMSAIHHTTCPLCEAGCGLRIETNDARTRVLDLKPDRDDPLSRGHMCVKAHALPRLHDDPDRLRRPVRKRADGSWEEVSWDDALDDAAARIHAVQSQHGHDAVAAYLGNPSVHNHEGLLGALGLLTALRTRNRYSATSTDQLPQMLAGLKMFGHQLMLPVPDVDRTDHLVILGANPVASNGSIMTAPGIGRRLRAIKKRGGKVVVIDPRRTETAELADEHHFIRPGTDPLFLLAVLNVLFTEDLDRLGSVEAFTDGLEELRQLSSHFPATEVAETVGIAADEIVRIARELATAPSAALYARVGVCTQRFGGLAAWLAWAVSIVTGNLDRPGGMMFTRPAIDAVKLAGMIGMTGDFGRWHSRVRGLPEFGGEFPVATLADEIETPGEGQVRALVTVAGNPVSSAPNGARLNRAVEQLDAMVSIDFYINETTRHADIILPPVSQLQRPYLHFVFGMFSVRHTAKASGPVLARDPDDRGDAEILMGLARRILARDGLKGRAASILAGIGEKLDFGIIADILLRLGPSDLTFRALRAEPHGVDLGPLHPVLPGRLQTPDGRIRLAPETFVKATEPLRRAWRSGALGGDQLRLIGRRNLRSNNSWMHNVEPLTGAAPCTLMMNPVDAESRGLSDEDRVRLTSRTGELEVELEVTNEIREGVVSLPHGHGHDLEGVRQGRARAHGGVSANDVTDEHFIDALTGNAAFNGVPVDVTAVEASG